MMSGFDRTDMTLPEVWASHSRNRPTKPALICGEEALDWRTFNARMNRLANALIVAGVQRGDRVAVLVSSSIAACIAMFGAVKSGAAMVPISSMLTNEQVLTILRDSAATHVICSADLRRLVDPIADQLPALAATGQIGTDFDGDGWVSLSDFCADASADEPNVSFAADDVFSVMYSSGTTGAPKGVVHTHGARTYFCVSNGFEMQFDANARGLVTTALYTAGTWLVVMPTLFVGGTLHIHSRHDSRRYMATLASERITHTFAVPSQLRALLSDGLLDECGLPELRVLLSAGSPLRPDEKRRLISCIGARFYELYGFTEGGSALLRPEDQLSKSLSVGKALMGQEILTIDANDAVCGPDEPGEIVTRGPGLLTAYYGRPEETQSAIWRDPRGRSYVRSGDVGRIDEDGFLYVLDRKKDMIITGGLNVFPADIEAVLAKHPAVADVCVIGIDHEKWGETPLGLVVLAGGSTTQADELAAWANARLAKHQRLFAVVLRDALPRNALGKVLKRELRTEYAAGAIPVANEMRI